MTTKKKTKTPEQLAAEAALEAKMHAILAENLADKKAAGPICLREGVSETRFINWCIRNGHHFHKVFSGRHTSRDIKTGFAEPAKNSPLTATNRARIRFN